MFTYRKYSTLVTGTYAAKPLTHHSVMAQESNVKVNKMSEKRLKGTSRFAGKSCSKIYCIFNQGESVIIRDGDLVRRTFHALFVLQNRDFIHYYIVVLLAIPLK